MKKKKESWSTQNKKRKKKKKKKKNLSLITFLKGKKYWSSKIRKKKKKKKKKIYHLSHFKKSLNTFNKGLGFSLKWEMFGQAFGTNKAIKQKNGLCSRPIGFQPCNSLWLKANFGLQLSMDLHSPPNSLSLSLFLSLSTEYIFLKKPLRSTFSFYCLLQSTFPSNSLYGVQLPRKFDGVHLSPTYTLSVFTEYIFLELSPTEYVSLQNSLRSTSFSNSRSFSFSLRSTFPSNSLLRSTFPSNPLYGVYFPPTPSTDYIIFLQLSTEYLRFPPSVCVCVSVSLCLSTEYIFDRQSFGRSSLPSWNWMPVVVQWRTGYRLDPFTDAHLV